MLIGVIGTGESVLPPPCVGGISSLVGLLSLSFSPTVPVPPPLRSELLPTVLKLVVLSLTRSLAATLGAGGGPFLVMVMLT